MNMLRKAVFLNDSSASNPETVSGEDNQLSAKTRNPFKFRHMPYNVRNYMQLGIAGCFPVKPQLPFLRAANFQICTETPIDI